MEGSNWMGNVAVAYYDEMYPTSWIARSTSLIIANHLCQNGFVKVNADMLRQWMERRIRDGTATNTTVVMAQDVAPDTIFERPRADCLLRKYLDSGGCVVWLGDVPFFYRGKASWLTSKVQAAEGVREPLGFDLQYMILGNRSSIVIPNGYVKIRGKGRKTGLNTEWLSERPVALKYLRRKKVLATTKLLPKIDPSDLAPQLAAAEKSKSILSSVTASGQAVGVALVFGSSIALIASTILPIFDPNLGKLTLLQIASTASIFIVGFILLLSSVNTRRKNRFASSWIAKYGQRGRFVRMWDSGDPQMNDALLNELVEVSRRVR